MKKIVLYLSFLFFTTNVQAQIKLYGLATQGGTSDLGTVFHYDLSTNMLVNDTSFGIENKGGYPYNNNLTEASNGKFYGVTNSGGDNNIGVLYEWDPITNIYKDKLSFSSSTGNSPLGSLTFYNGSMYGMTFNGGTGAGSIFEYNVTTAVYTTRYSFGNNMDGAVPEGSLLLYNNKFYGTTKQGTTSNGTIFKWDPTTNILTTLHGFDPFNLGDGLEPVADLSVYNGNLYGMTKFGGNTPGGSLLGTIFEYNLTTNTFTKKFEFTDPNGTKPLGSLFLYNSKFYGFTSEGGTIGNGVIFEWDPTTNIYTKKHDFDGITGSSPTENFMLYNGLLYGCARGGASAGKGVIFTFNPSTGSVNVVGNFNGVNGEQPECTLVQKNGKLYGNTVYGGGYNFSGASGVIFEFDPVANTITKKIALNATNGQYPRNSFSAYNGKLYSTTYSGGLGLAGTIIELNPLTNTVTKKLDINEIDGKTPDATMRLYNNKFYGTAAEGGLGGNGTIYEWNPATNIFTKKYEFVPATIGSEPRCSFTIYNNKFYGTTTLGGSFGEGTLFEFEPATLVATKKIDFNLATGTPIRANGSYVPYNGKFYLSSQNGGASGQGGIFEWNPITNALIEKFSFTTAVGIYPNGTLLLYNNKFYGLTSKAGDNGRGTIFEWDPTTNIFTKKFDFDDISGGGANGGLVQYAGLFYGVTGTSGANGFGTIFQWNPATNVFTKLADFDGFNGKYPQGDLTITNNGLVLPVTTLTFNATAMQGYNLLSWKSETENNLLEYHIEKSIDGNNFKIIGSIAAQNNTQNKYQYKDEEDNGVNKYSFYRLKIIDKNGSYNFSNIVKIANKDNKELLIYPSLASNTISVQGLDPNGTLQIIDVMGKIVLTQKVNTSTVNISVVHLASATYFMEYTNGDTKKIGTFIKK
jgi:uncharacterized repeat protein (TIGR03803 family)